MSLLAIVAQALVLLAVIASVFILFCLLAPQLVTLRGLGTLRRFVFVVVAWGFTAARMLAGIAVGLLGGYALAFGISW